LPLDVAQTGVDGHDGADATPAVLADGRRTLGVAQRPAADADADAAEADAADADAADVASGGFRLRRPDVHFRGVGAVRPPGVFQKGKLGKNE